MATVLRKTEPITQAVADAFNDLKAQFGAAGLLVQPYFKAADAAASTATAETPIFVANKSITISQIGFVPAAALTADNTNNAVITISRRNADGTNQVTVATITTNVANGSWTQWVEKSLGALTNASLTAGQMLTLTITKGGTGVVVPAGVLRVQDTTFHLDKSEQTVTVADATDLATSLALANQIKAVYEFHRVDTLAHKASDTTDSISSPKAVDLATAQTLANEIKADYNTHRASTTYHHNADATNVISSADATDQSSLNTLLNEIKTDLNAHMAAGSAAKSLRAVTG